MFALLTDRNASHVIQSILRRAPALLLEEYQAARGGSKKKAPLPKQPKGDSDDDDDEDDEDEDERDVPSMGECIAHVCRELSGDWDALCVDPQGSHIVRDLLAIAMGVNDIAKHAENMQDARKQWYRLPFSLIFAHFLRSAVSDSIVARCH